MGVQRLLRGLLKRTKDSGSPPSVKHQIDLRKLGRALEYSIQNPQLFLQALLHRSYLETLDEDSAESNERLEFLGDSVLNLIVSEYVYHRYPEAEEGELTKIRSRLVNRKALTAYARQLNLWDFMLVSSSAAQSVGRGSDTILADAFEALIAAVYLDGDYEAVRRFIQHQIEEALQTGLITTEDENFKSRLLEYAQANGFGVPRYVVLTEHGPDHDRTFTVEVYVGNRASGTGVGKNKKDAEQAAAEQAVEMLGAAHEVNASRQL